MSKTFLIHNGASSRGLKLCKQLLEAGNKVICADRPQMKTAVKNFLEADNFNFYPLSAETVPDIKENIDQVIFVECDFQNQGDKV